MKLFRWEKRRFLPYPVHQFLLRPKSDLAQRAKDRRDVQRLQVGDKAFLELYWKDLESGSGPAVLLNVEGYEIVKFDCLGKQRGHYHIQVMEWRRLGEKRLQLPEPNRKQQIDRALFELSANSQWFLDHHPLPRVRNAKIDLGRMAEATDKARDILMSYATESA